MRILTFDIEDWFHILDNKSTKNEGDWARYDSRLEANMSRLFDLLERTKQKATFFCLGWVADKYPSVIKEIDNRGFEIGSHSQVHQLVYQQEPGEFEEDLKRSLRTLENLIGKKVDSYRAPGFSITNSCEWAFDILAKHGITHDCSIFPARRSHGGMNGFEFKSPCLIKHKGHSIKEFPMSVFEVFGAKIPFSGGGYFRLVPIQALKPLFKNEEYIMTYFHPRDFDPDQPKISDLSILRKFKSYYGLGSALNKLESILSKYSFTDLRGASEMVNWVTVPEYQFQVK